MPGRKPTRILERSGAFQKNPSRRRNQEPVPVGPLGNPPERLDAEQLIFWRELESMCAKGVLTSADRWCVELAAVCMCKIVRQEAKGYDHALLRSLLSSMGLTPTDRSKLNIPPEKPQNVFMTLKNEIERPN